MISTRRHAVEIAKKSRMIAIQSLFATGFSTINRGLKLARQTGPDCMEILSGTASPEVVGDYTGLSGRSVFAGGLVKDRTTVPEILKSGASGVSTSEASLTGVSPECKVTATMQ